MRPYTTAPGRSVRLIGARGCPAIEKWDFSSPGRKLCFVCFNELQEMRSTEAISDDDRPAIRRDSATKKMTLQGERRYLFQAT